MPRTRQAGWSSSKGLSRRRSSKKTPRIGAGRFVADSRLTADVGEFFVVRYVHNFELLGVHRRVSSERQLSEIALLHFDEMLLILSAQTLENCGVDNDSQLKI